MKLIFLVSVFATWRLTELVTGDMGPWRIFHRLRQWSRGFTNKGYAEQTLGMLECPACVSIYAGAICSIPLWQYFDYHRWIGVAGIILVSLALSWSYILFVWTRNTITQVCASFVVKGRKFIVNVDDSGGMSYAKQDLTIEELSLVAANLNTLLSSKS